MPKLTKKAIRLGRTDGLTIIIEKLNVRSCDIDRYIQILLSDNCCAIKGLLVLKLMIENSKAYK